MSDDKFFRTLWSSKKGKVYMISHKVQIPELGKEGIIVNDMHTGEVVVFSLEAFNERFTRIKEYSFKNADGVDKIIKGKVV